MVRKARMTGSSAPGAVRRAATPTGVRGRRRGSSTDSPPWQRGLPASRLADEGADQVGCGLGQPRNVHAGRPRRPRLELKTPVATVAAPAAMVDNREVQVSVHGSARLRGIGVAVITRTCGL
jgi:hypothetical protein